jgi:hypothetical protein
MKQRISADGPLETPPGYLNGGVTLAEHLEFIADRTGIPIVADAYRVVLSTGGFRSESTVGEYLKGLQHSYMLQGTIGPTVFGYYGTSNGWLLARHNAFWRRERVEIPESTYEPLERAATSALYPSADDYAAFVAKLTPDQEFVASHASWDWPVRFPHMPLVAALYALKLLSTLTSEQRTAASSEAGLDLGELNSAQTQIVVEDWTNALWNGFLSGRLWGAVFSPGKIAALKPVLRFEESSGVQVAAEYELIKISQKPLRNTVTTKGIHVQFDYMQGLQRLFSEAYGIPERRG